MGGGGGSGSSFWKTAEWPSGTYRSSYWRHGSAWTRLANDPVKPENAWTGLRTIPWMCLCENAWAGLQAIPWMCENAWTGFKAIPWMCVNAGTGLQAIPWMLWNVWTRFVNDHKHFRELGKLNKSKRRSHIIIRYHRNKTLIYSITDILVCKASLLYNLSTKQLHTVGMKVWKFVDI
jgi:hypothetical protein